MQIYVNKNNLQIFCVFYICTVSKINSHIQKGFYMKRILLSAMILFGAHSNAMESSDGAQKRAEELHGFYLSEAVQKPILREINLVASSDERKAFFKKLVVQNGKISNEEAMFFLIRTAAQIIIKSPYYTISSPSYYAIEALDPIAWEYLKTSRKNVVI